jgi:hypothetical protein
MSDFEIDKVTISQLYGKIPHLPIDRSLELDLCYLTGEQFRKIVSNSQSSEDYEILADVIRKDFGEKTYRAFATYEGNKSNFYNTLCIILTFVLMPLLIPFYIFLFSIKVHGVYEMNNLHELDLKHWAGLIFAILSSFILYGQMYRGIF